MAATLTVVGWCGCNGCIGPADSSGPTQTSGVTPPRPIAAEGNGDNRHDLVVEPATLATASQRAKSAELDAQLDPTHGGWNSEALQDAAAAQLKRLSSLSAGDERGSQADLADEKFHCYPLRGKLAAVRTADPRIHVLRLSLDQDKPQLHRGRDGLRRALADLDASLGDNQHAAHKIFQVDLDDSQFVTKSYYHASGSRPTANVQQNATWLCRWTRPPDGSPPKLLGISVADFEEVQIDRTQPGAWYADATLQVVGSDPSFVHQLRHGINHWLPRIETRMGMSNYVRCGMAVGDVNGDGRDDVYVCQPGGLPNRLLVQNADATATDRAASAGVDWLDHTASALLVDLDNDGDQDLALAMPGHVLLAANDGRGNFSAAADLECDADVHSLSAADYDNDGDLDIFLCVDFADADEQRRLDPFVYHDAQDGGANALFRNDTPKEQSDGKKTAWRFTDVTQDTGLDEANHRHSLAASWEDFDEDGDVDLYVANDHGPNNLFRNDDGRFVDVAVAAGVQDFGSGMSTCWGDYNRDGRMDLYVGNMYSSAGNRISRLSKFKPDASDQTRAVYRRFAKGNTLFQNLGDQKFAETGDEAAVEMGRWAWSSIFLDMNNDGWEDIFVANGNITKEDTDDL